jgi:hypothetical protein
MIQNRKFRRAARVNRAKAFLFTALFHLVLVGSILNDSAYEKIETILPTVVTEWLGWEQEEATEPTAEEKLLRP